MKLIKYLTYMFLCIFSLNAFAEDYSAYALMQAQKKEQIIAPFIDDTRVLQTNALQKIQSAKIQNMIAPLVNKNINLEANHMPHTRLSNVMIFVSFSMPKDSLKSLIMEAYKIKASVVVRGLVNNSFKDTAKTVSELVSEKNKGGVQIDPTMFKRYQITKVPAFVVTQNFASNIPVNKNVSFSQLQDKSTYDVLYGDVTLDYALEFLASHGEAVNDNAKIMLDQLRGKNV